jgi:hypothetical protein
LKSSSDEARGEFVEEYLTFDDVRFYALRAIKYVNFPHVSFGYADID